MCPMSIADKGYVRAAVRAFARDSSQLTRGLILTRTRDGPDRPSASRERAVSRREDAGTQAVTRVRC